MPINLSLNVGPGCVNRERYNSGKSSHPDSKSMTFSKSISNTTNSSLGQPLNVNKKYSMEIKPNKSFLHGYMKTRFTESSKESMASSREVNLTPPPKPPRIFINKTINS